MPAVSVTAARPAVHPPTGVPGAPTAGARVGNHAQGEEVTTEVSQTIDTAIEVCALGARMACFGPLLRERFARAAEALERVREADEAELRAHRRQAVPIARTK